MTANQLLPTANTFWPLGISGPRICAPSDQRLPAKLLANARGGLARLALVPAAASSREEQARLVGEPDVLGRLGSLEVRLARGRRELRLAQRLRFRVFYEEMSARAGPMSALLRRDADRFDEVCDHLLVVDRGAPRHGGGKPRVVGTYRLLRQDVAIRAFGFYADAEFDIGPLLAACPDRRFLELGRSCVLAGYRDKRALELLWRGIYAYVRRYGIDMLMGCASFPGTQPDILAQPLSFLHHFARCPESRRVRARDHRFVSMDMLPKSQIDVKLAMRGLPPLVKGYLRLGASVGEGAVVDRQFGTTDVFVLLPMSAVAARYLDHLSPSAERTAA